MIRYTSRVRRGFAVILPNLLEVVRAQIADERRRGVKIPMRTAHDFEVAVLWMKQEAAREEEAESTPTEEPSAVTV